MAFERWTPRQDYTKREDSFCAGCVGRENCSLSAGPSARIFDDGFQAELEAMYRDTGAGREPVPPALSR